jgi:hypothetical protein
MNFSLQHYLHLVITDKQFHLVITDKQFHLVITDKQFHLVIIDKQGPTALLFFRKDTPPSSA